jgi:uncharacterized protein (TIGR02246 family)
LDAQSTVPVHALIASYLEAERHLDAVAVAEHFCLDGVLIDANGVRHVGHVEVRRAYESVYAGVSHIDVALIGEYLDGDRGAIEWTATSVRKDGSVRQRGVSVIHVKGGRFAEIRVYVGPSTR